MAERGGRYGGRTEPCEGGDEREDPVGEAE